MKKRISILGATGSVGLQALDVARHRGYRVDFLAANSNVREMESAAREFCPAYVAMSVESAANDLRQRLSDTSIKVLSGTEGIKEGIVECGSDIVINAILGSAGLIPTLEVINSGKTLALANKESLVIAGDIVMRRASEHGVSIVPVDSEHSAIYQSLKSGKTAEIKRIFLTASGGPFFGKSREELANVTLADTLAHPTWKMGKKITVDSATLMNKGFEIIEAAHLFSVEPEKIEVVVHRESILHSAVEFIDNTVIGEFSVPDMRMCVQYAVDYPERCASYFKPLNLFEVGKLTFAAPDTNAFPLLELARVASSDGGASCAVLNAADEIAVAAFLREEIGFVEIYEAVRGCYDALPDAKQANTLDAILEYDSLARIKASEIVDTIRKKHTAR